MGKDNITITIRANQTQFAAAIAAASKSVGDLQRKVAGSSGGFKSFASQASSAFDSVANSISSMLKMGAGIALSGSFGLGAAAKAAWDQVDAVQQAKAGLDRYYSSASDVNMIMSSLVKYAQSDAGVLFNRKDLFNSAQGLAMYNIEASKVTGYVKIISRGMASGRLSWDEMDRVIGRVIATSKLGADEFDMLRKAGFNLKDGLRNASMGADELFRHLDNSIAKDVSQDLSNITPIGIRLQSALRGIGNAFLGVNDTGDKFVHGGVGYAINQMLQDMTTFLKTPELKAGIAKIGKQLAQFMKDATPVIKDVLLWMVNNMDTVVAGVNALAVAFVGAKVAALGFKIAEGITPMKAFATAIVVVVSILTFLQQKYDIFGKASQAIGSVVNWVGDRFNDLKNVAATAGTAVADAFKGVAEWFRSVFTSAWNNVKDAWSGTKSFFETKWSEITTTLKPFTDKIGQVFSDIGKKIAPVFDDVKHLVEKGIIAPFGNVWSDIQKGAQTGIKPVLKAFEPLKDAFKPIQDAIQKALLPLFKQIKRSFEEIMATIRSSLEPAFKNIGILWQKLQKTFETVKKALEPYAEELRKIWKEHGEKIMNVLKAIGAIIVGVLLAPLAVLVATIAAVVAAFMLIVVGVAKVVELASPWIKGLIELIGGIVAGIVANITGLIGVVTAVIGAAIQFVSSAIGAAATIITGLVKTVVDTISGIIAGVVTYISGILEIVRGVFTGNLDLIKNGFSQVFGGIGQIVLSVFNMIAGTVTSTMRGVFQFMIGIWNSVRSLFVGAAIAIGGAFSGAIRGALNGVFGLVEGIVNTFVNAVNGAVGMINKIPGVHIGAIGHVKLPRLATGGIIPPTPGGQHVVVAEGGQAEWVVPESKMASLIAQVIARTDGRNGAPSKNVTINNEYNVKTQVDAQRIASDMGYLASQL